MPTQTQINQAQASAIQREAINQALKLGLLSFGAGAAVRSSGGLLNQIRRNTRKARRPAITAPYPVNVYVPPREEENKIAADQHTKTADYWSDLFSGAGNSRGSFWAGAIPLSVTAGAAGIGSGWKLADILLDEQRKKQTEQELKNVQDKYLRALQGRSKLGQALDNLYTALEKQGEIPIDILGPLLGVGLTVAGTGALGSGLLTYNLVKERDKHNLRRKAKKQYGLEQYQRRLPPIIGRALPPAPSTNAKPLSEDNLEQEDTRSSFSKLSEAQSEFSPQADSGRIAQREAVLREKLRRLQARTGQNLGGPRVQNTLENQIQRIRNELSQIADTGQDRFSQVSRSSPNFTGTPESTALNASWTPEQLRQLEQRQQEQDRATYATNVPYELTPQAGPTAQAAYRTRQALQNTMANVKVDPYALQPQLDPQAFRVEDRIRHRINNTGPYADPSQLGFASGTLQAQTRNQVAPQNGAFNQASHEKAVQDQLAAWTGATQQQMRSADMQAGVTPTRQGVTPTAAPAPAARHPFGRMPVTPAAPAPAAPAPAAPAPAARHPFSRVPATSAAPATPAAPAPAASKPQMLRFKPF